MSLFFYLVFHWGDIVEKALSKVSFRKKIKRGFDHLGGLSIEVGVQTFCLLCNYV